MRKLGRTGSLEGSEQPAEAQHAFEGLRAVADRGVEAPAELSLADSEVVSELPDPAFSGLEPVRGGYHQGVEAVQTVNAAPHRLFQ